MPPYPCPVSTWHAQAYAAISPLLPHLSTKGKNIVITGGGSGIGSAIARSFAASGADSISILGRREEKLLQTKSRIQSDYPGITVFTHITDLVDQDAVKRTFNAIKSSVGIIDILVANAGYSPKLLSLNDSNHDEWYDAFEINVKGNFNLIQAFLPMASRAAAVLNVAAGASHVPYLPGFSGYVTSKLAAAKLFDYLHYEHPDFFVLNFHPGIVKTEIEGNPNALAFDDSESVIWEGLTETDVLSSRASGEFCSGKS